MKYQRWGHHPITRFFIILFLTFYLSPFTISYADNLNYVAPSKLPGVTSEMTTAGFWISRHPYPDKLIMSPVGIVKFNAMTRAEGLTQDLVAFPERYDGQKLKSEITKIADGIKGQKLFQENTSLADDALYTPLIENMALATIPASVEVRFGFIVAPADERLLPTNFALYAKAGDVDFDELQNSGLDIGTAVVVLHSTADNRWLFVKDALASGWAEAERVALVKKEELAGHLRRKDIVVVVSPKADIFRNREMTEYSASVKMGARFVLKNASARFVEVLVPQHPLDGSEKFRSGFVAREDVNLGYLPYTPRTVLRQAFKMLGAPYGWGDMYGAQDCSRFIQMVFATVGLEMPRNSAEQGKTGATLGEFGELILPADKQALISTKAVGALALLRLKGHIMLYLGQFHDRLFAIHATWAYREPGNNDEERPRVLNRVVVSDLSLGEASAKGSLLKRILSVRDLAR